MDLTHNQLNQTILFKSIKLQTHALFLETYDNNTQEIVCHIVRRIKYSSQRTKVDTPNQIKRFQKFYKVTEFQMFRVFGV